jgi:hypothetical protein
VPEEYQIAKLTAPVEIQTENLPQQIADTKRALEGIESEIQRFQNELRAGVRTFAQFETATEATGQEAQRLQARLASLQAQLGDQLKREAKETADTLAQETAAAIRRVEEEARQTTVALVGLTNEFQEASEGAIRTSRSVGLVAGAIDDTSKRSRAGTAAAVEFGRGLEDVLVTGRAYGAINNINQALDGFLLQMRASPALIAGSTFAITALGLALDAVVKNWSGIQEKMGTGIPRPALDGMKDLEATLGRAKKEMAEFADKTRLSFPELVKFRELQDKIAESEELIRKGRQVQGIRDIKSQADQDAARQFREAVERGGGGGTVVDELTEALRNQADERGRVFSTFLNQAGTPRQIAEEMARQAFEGNRQVIGEIRQRITQGFGGRETQFTGAMDAVKAEADQKANEEARKRAAVFPSREELEEGALKQQEKRQREIAAIGPGRPELLQNEKRMAQAQEEAAREAEQARKRAEREEKAAPRTAREAREADLARQFQQRGYTGDQAEDLAKRTLDLTGQNVNLNAAAMIAMREQNQKIFALQQQIQSLQGGWQMQMNAPRRQNGQARAMLPVGGRTL